MNNRINRLYHLTPVWVQNFIISIYGYKLYKQRYGKEYRKAFSLFINKDYSSLIKELEIQNSELKRLIGFAYKNSKFYRELYKDVDIGLIKTVEDLKLLPVVEKDLFRKNLERIYTISESEAIPSFTGGTTGKSLKVLYTQKDFQHRMAYLDAFKHRVGVDVFKCKKATFSGRELIGTKRAIVNNIFWRFNWIYNQKLYSTFHLTEKNIPFYLEDLNKFKPEVLNGFVSAIYELAKFIERKKIRLTFSPKAIFTTSETLLPIHKEVIERAFDSRVYNQYASAEGAPFITECEYGNLHYNIDTGVIETIETDHGNDILVTSFTTYGTPLIRYKIGDNIVFKKGNCPCGSAHPLVEKIEGRQVDYLMSSEGKKISLSHLADVIKGFPNGIINMQFEQKSSDLIQINIVIDKGNFATEGENLILKEMQYRFGVKTRIVFNYVNEIKREKSGKFALIKIEQKVNL